LSEAFSRLPGHTLPSHGFFSASRFGKPPPPALLLAAVRGFFFFWVLFFFLFFKRILLSPLPLMFLGCFEEVQGFFPGYLNCELFLHLRYPWPGFLPPFFKAKSPRPGKNCPRPPTAPKAKPLVFSPSASKLYVEFLSAPPSRGRVSDGPVFLS